MPSGVRVDADYPISHEAEMSLVGAVMLNPDVMPHASDIRPEDFGDAALGQVWGHIRGLWTAGTPPSLFNVVHTMPLPEGGDRAAWRDALTSYCDGVVSIIAIPDYVRIVRDYADRRRIMQAAADMVREAGDTGNNEPAAAIAARGIAAIDRSASDDTEFHDAAVVHERIMADLDRPLRCYSTGFPRLDAALGGGLYPGRLYGLSARHKAGKTTMMSSIAYNLAAIDNPELEPIPTLYLSLEQEADEVMLAMVARAMSGPGQAFSTFHFRTPLRQAGWFRDRAARTGDRFRERRLSFRTRPRLSLDDLKASLARIGLGRKVRVVLVDYLQLVSGARRGQSGAEHLDNVAQTLKEAATKYDLAIVVAAQTNSEGGVRGGEGILNACDALMFLNRCTDAQGLPIVEGGNEPEGHPAWIDMPLCRYMPSTAIGSNLQPAYLSDYRCGPHFRENPPPAAPFDGDDA
ncbi:MAG: DnaB-like helicase C-terminal domain-containing protein [Gemmatimonadota bacterium]